MSAFYSVVQYVPDPVRDERINIGVLVLAGGKVYPHFLKSWHRVRVFGEENIEFLHSFVRQANRLTEEKVREIAGSWHCSIQLTAPAGSLLSPSDLLVDAISRYLRDSTSEPRQYRNRQQAIAIARSSVRQAVETRLGRAAARLVKNDLPILGPRGRHEFDVGAQNGRPYFAARALSFEGGNSSALLRQIESTECAIEDVRRDDESLPLAVVVLPPRADEDGMFGRAVETFKELEAEVIEEEHVNEWAARMAGVLSEGWHGSA
jgi:Protein of unknown function (DUF3037)